MSILEDIFGNHLGINGQRNKDNRLVISELIQRSAAYDWHPFQRSSGVDSKDIRIWAPMASEG